MPTTPKIIKAVIAGSGGFVGGSAVRLAFLRDQVNKVTGNVIPLKNFRTAADIKKLWMREVHDVLFYHFSATAIQDQSKVADLALKM